MNGPPEAGTPRLVPRELDVICHSQTLIPQRHPQPRTREPGTGDMSLRARQPHPSGCEPDTRRADQRCQGTNGPAGSAGMTPRGAGTTADGAPLEEQIRARRRTLVGQGQDLAGQMTAWRTECSVSRG